MPQRYEPQKITYIALASVAVIHGLKNSSHNLNI